VLHTSWRLSAHCTQIPFTSVSSEKLMAVSVGTPKQLNGTECLRKICFMWPPFLKECKWLRINKINSLKSLLLEVFYLELISRQLG